MKRTSHRPRRNPSPLDNPAFRRWFGDSKIVDSQGRPKVMYHGTGATPFDEFIDWRPMFFTSEKSYAESYTHKALHGRGRPRVIKAYLSIARPFDTRIEAHRRVYNETFVPWATSKFTAPGPGGRSTAERFRPLKPGELVSFIAADHLFSFLKREAREGRLDFDGLYVSEDGFHDEPTVSPLRASQIKSATNNVGTYDPSDPSILRNPASSKLYHGSNEDWLEELDGNEPGYTGSLGWGLYLTTDPDFAAKFGKRIYEVESPVPDELVAYIEPMTYDCGNDLTFYTPGSTPFTFEIVDRKTGKTHRYSVLGDCEEEVRQDLRRWALDEFVPSQELKDDVNELPAAIASRVGVGAKEILDAASKGERVDDVIDAVLDTMSEEGVDGALLDDEIKPLLEALEREIDEFADAKVAERLGDEIDLDDISATVSRHGYSAFFISDYAPGDEYVIVDEKYLPIPVTK